MKSELWEHIGAKSLTQALNSNNRYFLFRTACFICVLILYYLFYLSFLILSYPFTIAFPRTRKVYDRYFAAGFWTLSCYILELNDVETIVIGDKLEAENAVFISNHRSLIDYIIFPYLATQISENNKFKSIMDQQKALFARDLTSILLPRLSFFTWFQIWNMPSLRFWKDISQTDENWELDGDTMASTFNEYLDDFDGVQWLVTFPEVNIYTEANSKMEQVVGEKYYIPPLTHVLYPRFSGFSNCIGGLYKSTFNRVYDTTILYIRKKEDGTISFQAPTLLEAFGLTKDKFTVLIHIHGKLMNHVPLRRDKLEKWVERRWVKKDHLLEKLESKVK